LGARMRGTARERASLDGPALVRGLLPYLEVGLVLLAVFLWCRSAGWIWYREPWLRQGALLAGGTLSLWPLLPLALAWLLRIARTGRILQFRALDIPLWLFIASAAESVWAAYDRQTSLYLFYMLVAALGLYYALSGQPDGRHLRVMLGAWGLCGVLFSLAFLATNDASTVEKLPVVASIAQRVQALLPSLGAPFVNPNDAGCILAVTLPCYVPLIAGRNQDSPDGGALTVVLWSLAAGIVALGWVLSLSRGAWVGLLIALLTWLVWRLGGRLAGRNPASPHSVWRARVAVTAVFMLLAVVLAVVLGGLVLRNVLPGGDTLANRLELTRSGLLLARDYPLTGAGIGMFPMHYSLYTLLIQVGYIASSQNTLVDLLIEQGVLGWLAAACFGVGVVVLALRTLRHGRREAAQLHWITEASLAGLLVALIHGLVQNVFYGSPAVLLLALPLGLIAATARQLPSATRSEPSGAAWARWTLAGAVLMVPVGAGVWQRHALAGVWYANLGALAQARIELTAYDPELASDMPLDQVRLQADLTDAEGLLERATQADPGNTAALLRLTSLDLSYQRYGDALQHAQAAWDAGHRDSVTRLLFGDALVAAGRPTEAAEVVAGVAWAPERLWGQAWDRYWLGGDYQRASDAWATLLVLDPGNTDAAYWQSEAKLVLEEQSK
jgi:putative inorganic carbon (hco3(-)) transporter